MRALGLRARHRWLLTALCAALWLAAFVATHIPLERMPKTGMTDKGLHFWGYAGLTAILWLTLRAWAHPAARRIIICATVLMIYGALDEYTQRFVNRWPSVVDWLYNCLGIAAALTVLELTKALADRRKA